MTSTTRVVLIGGASGTLYAATYALQRSIAPVHAGTGSALTWIVTLYLVVTVVQFVLYGMLISLASRGALESGRARALALVFPVLFNAALLAGRPSLSIDVFTYIAHGYQASIGQSPYAHPVKEVAEMPFGRELARFGWIPVHGVSPYGPIWTEIEATVVRATPDIPAAMLAIKTIVTLFSLGCALMIWSILAKVAPRPQLIGTLLYLWNPVTIVEFAGEGHNDAVMMFFMLLSLFLWLRAREGVSMVATACAALVKVVGVMLVPLELVYAWRTHHDRRRLVGQILVGAGIAAGIAVLVLAPVWIGWHTFDGLRAHSRPSILASTPGVLYWYLIRSHSEQASALLLSTMMTGAFAAAVAFACLTVKDAASLLRACGFVAVVYLVVAPGYWPWYAAMPIALLALTPDRTFVWAIVAVSVASRLAAPIDTLRLDGWMDWEREMFIVTIVGVWLPVALLSIRAAWRPRYGRSQYASPVRYVSS